MKRKSIAITLLTVSSLGFSKVYATLSPDQQLEIQAEVRKQLAAQAQTKPTEDEVIRLHVKAAVQNVINAQLESLHSLYITGGGLLDLSKGVSVANGIQLNASSDQSNTTLKFNRFLASPPSSDTERSFGLALGIPLEKGDKLSPINNQDNLVSGTSLSLSYRWQKNNYVSSTEDGEKAITALCTKLTQNLPDLEKVRFNSLSCKDFIDKIKASAKISGITENDLVKFQQISEGILKLNQPTDAWIVAVDLGTSHEEKKWYDTVNIATKDTSRTHPIKASLSLGQTGSSRYYGISYTYQHSYKDQITQTICPVAHTTTVTCTTGSFGKPTEFSSSLVGVDASYLGNPAPHISQLSFIKGVSLSAVHNTKTDLTTVKLPIYLLNDKDNVPSAALVFGYQSDSQNPSFSVGISLGQLYKPSN